MGHILALIGLITIFWLISRVLKKVSTSLISIGDALCDYAAAVQEKPEKDINKIKSKKEPSNDDFTDEIRKEIEEITKAKPF